MPNSIMLNSNSNTKFKNFFGLPLFVVMGGRTGVAVLTSFVGVFFIILTRVSYL